MVGMFFVPSSPVFLLSQDREQEARKALQWLRGSSYDIEKEIQEVSWHVQNSVTISIWEYFT